MRGLLAAGCTSRIDGTGVSLGEPWTGAEGLALGPDAAGHQAPCSRGAQFTRRKSPIVWCIVLIRKEYDEKHGRRSHKT